MKKFINSLLYGSEQTKSYLIVIIGLSILTVVFGILCVIKLSFGFGLLCVVAGILDGIILNNITFEDETYLLKRKEVIEKEKEERKEEHKTEGDIEKEKVDNFIEQNQELEQEDLAEDKSRDSELKQKEKKKVLREEQEDIVVDLREQDEEENPYKQYTKETMKKLFYKYKIKEEHRKVIIDFCAPFRIKQCPAYVWRDRKNLYFLLLEEEARKIEIALNQIDGIHYEKGVVVKSSLDYDKFKEQSFVGSLFLPYLPSYYEKVKNEKRCRCKNLYVITPELKVTNTSARSLFDILEEDFILQDKIMTSNRFDTYFKIAYKSNILLRDQVITPEEYRDKIRLLLTSISQGEMSERDYIFLINQLEEYQLITKEYANYYREDGLTKRKE